MAQDYDGCIHVDPSRQQLFVVAQRRLWRKVTVLCYQMGIPLEQLLAVISDPRATLARTLVSRLDLHQALEREVDAAAVEGRPPIIVEVLHDERLIQALLLGHVADEGIELVKNRPHGTVPVLIIGADRGMSIVVATPTLLIPTAVTVS